VQYKDGGLNLTRATLDGLIKYPYPLLSPQNDGKPQSKGYYLSCKGLVDSVKLRDDRTFECQIMNWSDDVAYSSHDLEDGLVIGTIRKEDLENKRDQIATWAVQSFIKEHPDLEDTALFEIDEAKRFINDVIKHCIDEQSRGDRLAVIKEFVRRHIGKCVMSVEADDVKDAPSVRYSRRVLKDAETAKRVETYKAIVMVGVIRTTPVLTLQQAGKRAIEDIFNRLMDWQDRETPYLFPLDMRDDAVVLGRLSESDVEQHRELRPETISKSQTFVRDYVASLTDRHAEDLWRRMFLPGSGSALFVARL
jgi:dGTPase